VTRARLIDWYRNGRDVTRRLFTIPTDEAYHDRPIPLRNPLVFYEGHLPVFAVNTLLRLALKRDGIDGDFEALFARGIDPEDEASANVSTDLWPAREQVRAYGSEADERIMRALCDGAIDDGREPQTRNAEAAFTILEHEQMHQETLLYLFHELPYERKNPIPPLFPAVEATPLDVVRDMVRIPAGEATLGSSGDEFGWDNERPAITVSVPEFSVDRHNVTNGEYLKFVEETGANPPHFWDLKNGSWQLRALFALIELPLDWPVYATWDEASAYARWRGKRLMSEAEYHRAAFGSEEGERLFPWGDALPDATRGNFGFTHWDPVATGSYPAGVSAWGVHDLVGNGWEWTSTIFDGFPGFRPMSSYLPYSTDFFDGKHYVLKGASPATAPELIRRSFRNWFRPGYPYAYATFRCAHD